MNLKKVHHIAIIGSDYEKSKHFYVDLLGFSIIRENYRPERDDYKIDLQLDEIELELFIQFSYSIIDRVYSKGKMPETVSLWITWTLRTIFNDKKF